ncbi:outer membrane lipid asymmetry maintenance protein MlaD [Acidihalobacter aeolianus]|uniref:Outer membrane lipid asymmetry maintenance protein MlaD n=1 Tax=Acidihalobacter aeolianus TaxID=2792603 RepID=A0A1D8KAE1_9GAMM|nr:outer membrane lipid asymmetry maintenance protein MlaD [Acidihalobacter aeolianus]AOV17938.1 outer membrane lipid asymmetry maintenance protein MlaD [Acidihalobacter aeolianus]
MNTRSIEILVGLFVAAGCLALLVLAMKVSNLTDFSGGNGYKVYAYFNDIGGLKVNSPVTAAGVQVGRVDSIQYDAKNFEAKVTMSINDKYHDFPVDTSASIYTAGLLGAQYISLSPGASEQVLKNGSRIQYTQSAVVLEKIIGQLMVKLTSK